jgi:hypothetical protein
LQVGDRVGERVVEGLTVGRPDLLEGRSQLTKIVGVDGNQVDPAAAGLRHHG